MYKMIKKIPGVYMAETASVMGDVQIGKDASIWYGAVVRGDEDRITIGRRTNIQDNCVLHVDEGFPLHIGDDVTVGHAAILHGCTIGDGTLVGMGAVVLNGAKIGKNCIIGAGALVTGKMDAPDGSMIIGSPAIVKRSLTEKEIAGNKKNVEIYVKYARDHFE